jgi:hypothetical protein
VRSINLPLSLVLAILPLLGVAWLFVGGMITLAPPSATVDGLFMALILLTLSGTFWLNAYWEMRDHGILGKKTPGKKESAPPAAKSPAAKVS